MSQLAYDGAVDMDYTSMMVCLSVLYGESYIYQFKERLRQLDLAACRGQDLATFLQSKLPWKQDEEEYQEKTMADAFEHFVKEGQSSISIEEFGETLGREYNNTFEWCSWGKLVQEVDENGDGELSFAEFQNLI